MGSDVYGVIDVDGTIINVVLWDGDSGWAPPEGHTTLKLENSGAGIGWVYKKGVFIAPPEPEIPIEEIMEQANIQKNNLIAESTLKISILEDAVDNGMANDDEIIQLEALRKYRVLLYRVDASKGVDILWPEIG